MSGNGGIFHFFFVQSFDPRTLFLIEPLPRKDIVSVPEYGLAVHQPPHQLLRPAGLLPSAIEMIFLLLVLAISLDQGTAPIQLCLVSVSDPGSRVLGIGKANKVRDSAQQLLPCLNRISKCIPT
jgi:hypothetical protein